MQTSKDSSHNLSIPPLKTVVRIVGSNPDLAQLHNCWGIIVMVKLQTFCTRANRDKLAAKRFWSKVLKAKHNQEPRVINVDKNPAYPPAIEELKESGFLSIECELRQKKHLNNLIELWPRFPKKLAKYKSYFQYFHTAWRTLKGYEIMNAIRKGQIENIAKGDIRSQRDFIHSLFGITV